MIQLARRVFHEEVEDLYLPQQPNKGDIIRRIEVEEEEKSWKYPEKNVYFFSSGLFPNTKGIIFPKDDIIQVEQAYDIVINRIVQKERIQLLMSSIYHGFDIEYGQAFPVQISDIGRFGDPIFRIHDYIGFVKNTTAKIGEKALVRIDEKVKGKVDYLKASIIRFLE
jgi:predicted RNA-binding protein with TRAM domain